MVAHRDELLSEMLIYYFGAILTSDLWLLFILLFSVHGYFLLHCKIDAR